MAHKINLLPGVLLFISLGAFAASSEAINPTLCNFPAIFNFGDSNSDTGDYFSDANDPKTVKIKRLASDGRLIMDFITEKMGRPYLPNINYGKNYRTGATCAVGGSTIRHLETSPFPYLASEAAKFTEFKAQVSDLQSQGKRNETLPMPQDFKKSLYTIDIGQNDLTQLLYGPYDQEIPDLIRVFAAGVKNLYDEGARVFWIHNTGPHGCLPGIDYARPQNITRDLDEFGCLKHDNQVASEFNMQLKNKVFELRAELFDAVFTYVDVYTAKYKLFSNAKNLGFFDHAWSCNRTCTDPSKYILWDGIHYTEAANRLVAEDIFNGALSDTSLPITQACY